MLAIGPISVLRRKRRLREWRLKRKPNSWGTLAGPLSKHNNSKLHNQHLTLLFSPCQPSATTLTRSTGNLRSQTTQGPPQPTTQATQEELPPPLLGPPLKQENQTSQNTQPAVLPTFGMIMPISGGSSLEFENKKQRRNYFRQVHSIMVDGPV